MSHSIWFLKEAIISQGSDLLSNARTYLTFLYKKNQEGHTTMLYEEPSPLSTKASLGQNTWWWASAEFFWDTSNWWLEEEKMMQTAFFKILQEAQSISVWWCEFLLPLILCGFAWLFISFLFGDTTETSSTVHCRFDQSGKLACFSEEAPIFPEKFFFLHELLLFKDCRLNHSTFFSHACFEKL